MSNWKPVEYGRAIGRNSSEIRINRDGVVSANGLLFDFPDSLRLCERVPDEPITAETLQRDGWERDSTILGIWKMKCTNALGEIWYLFWNDRRGNTYYPGCATMSDLRTLVRLLGGDA